MANFTGTSGNNTITGTQGADVISALGGADTVNSLGGNDNISAGAGNDTVNGGAGNDTLFGQNDNDSLLGGIGTDSLDGGNGSDRLFGQSGNDSLIGGAGNDSLSGDSGNDTLIGVNPTSASGASEIDTLTGGSGIDRFVLGQGSQVFYSSNGDSNYALITGFDPTQDVIQLVANSDPGNANEIDDAGQDLFSAQIIPSGTTPLDSISGTISSNSDVDLYQITLEDGTFSATTTGGGVNFDTQLFLFDEDGTLLLQNDDINGTNQSTISDSIIAAGTYFLAISSFNNDPTSSELTDFTGAGNSNGDYTIDLTGVVSAPNPAFSLGESPNDLLSGTGIFYENDLIAIVQGASIPDFSSGFNFV